MTSIYNYVAEGNPEAATQVIKKYGYNITGVSSTDGLGECLRQLVAAEKEPALMDIAGAHPDKELLFELFGKQQAEASKGSVPFQSHRMFCTCNACTGNMHNAIGGEPVVGGGSVATFFNNPNAVVLTAAVLISAALIYSR